jgi:hypothetical protein
MIAPVSRSIACSARLRLRSVMSGFRRARAGWGPLLAAALVQVVSHTIAISGQPDRYAAVLEGILAAWKTADVVCLGEDHGRQFDSDLRIRLVRHPAFPRTVRVIVIEFANPIHQDLLDSFIVDGVAMSREELAPIWRDASGAEVWESPIYEQFLRAVHDVNRGLQRGERVRVVGGDSTIDWARIVRAEDLVPLVNRGRISETSSPNKSSSRISKALRSMGRAIAQRSEADFQASSLPSSELIASGPSGRWWAKKVRQRAALPLLSRPTLLTSS